MPDITRIFKGIKNEFEVEIVFAEEGEESPKESHPYEEIAVVAAGGIRVVRSDDVARNLAAGGGIGAVPRKVHTAPNYIHIPARVEHQFIPTVTPTKVVVIHPNR